MDTPPAPTPTSTRTTAEAVARALIASHGFHAIPCPWENWQPDTGHAWLGHPDLPAGSFVRVSGMGKYGLARDPLEALTINGRVIIDRQGNRPALNGPDMPDASASITRAPEAIARDFARRLAPAIKAAREWHDRNARALEDRAAGRDRVIAALGLEPRPNTRDEAEMSFDPDLGPDMGYVRDCRVWACDGTATLDVRGIPLDALAAILKILGAKGRS